MAQVKSSNQRATAIFSKFKRFLLLYVALIAISAPTAASSTSGANGINPLFGYLAIFLPFIGAALVPTIYKLFDENTGYFAAIISATTLSMLILAGKGTFSATWVNSLGIQISLYIDGLSFLLGLLASGIGILIFSYSPSYMHGEKNQAKYYSLLLAFLGSMMGIALSGDLVSMFVFWELTSITSFFLIGFYTNKKASQLAARKSMIITIGGGIFMIAAILMINTATGTFSIPELLQNTAQTQEQLRNAGLFLPALACLLVGAGAKSAQVPLHIWLPDAMQAPTPVSAFLHSATMVKAGVFLIGRTRPILESIEWSMIVITMGLGTMTIAGILAVKSTDIKELLAYSTASHLGIIVAAFGFPGILGAEAGVFHMLNHASFKAALFLVAGIVAHEAGTRKIKELSGLYRYLPVTSLIAIVGSLSMAGLPPFNGFQSKELLFEASWEFAAHSGGLTWLAPAVAVIGGAFSFAYSIKFASLFLGKSPDHDIHKPPAYMLISPAILLIILTALTAFPQYFIDLIVNNAITATATETAHLHVSIIPHLKPAMGMSVIAVGLGAAIYRFYETFHNSIILVLKKYRWISANYWYDFLLDHISNAGMMKADLFNHGALRGYSMLTLGGFSVITLAAVMFATPSMTVGTGISLAAGIIITIAVIAGISTIRSDSHVSGLLNLSVLGAMVSIFYILARAPDLALTQLVVETLSLVIFILILDKLPDFYGELEQIKKIENAVIAGLVGVTVTISTILATSATPDKISGFFVDNAVKMGGGGNIVNVILVDFRAFDTMGEISVVAMAALSVLTLFAMRGRNLWFKEEDN